MCKACQVEDPEGVIVGGIEKLEFFFEKNKLMKDEEKKVTLETVISLLIRFKAIKI
jgi:hypothetical protein